MNKVGDDCIIGRGAARLGGRRQGPSCRAPTTDKAACVVRPPSWPRLNELFRADNCRGSTRDPGVINRPSSRRYLNPHLDLTSERGESVGRPPFCYFFKTRVLHCLVEKSRTASLVNRACEPRARIPSSAAQ